MLPASTSFDVAEPEALPASLTVLPARNRSTIAAISFRSIFAPAADTPGCGRGAEGVGPPGCAIERLTATGRTLFTGPVSKRLA